MQTTIRRPPAGMPFFPVFRRITPRRHTPPPHPVSVFPPRPVHLTSAASVHPRSGLFGGERGERNKLASRAHRNNNILPREYSPLPTSPPRISSARLPSFPIPASPLFHHPFRPPAASPRRSPAQSVAVVRSTSHPHTHRKSPFFPATGRRRG